MEMKQLINAVIIRLRDPAESVAKTAKKLLLELHKCYPNVFKANYIETLPSEDERNICNLIVQNNFEEATRLILSTSPSKRMASNPQPQQLPDPAEPLVNDNISKAHLVTQQNLSSVNQNRDLEISDRK